jgi:hypothetical protein
MGRNYFSKAGGPYFINDGFSHHTDHDHESGHNHDDIKPSSNLFYGLTIGFGIAILLIGIGLIFAY